MGLITKAGEAAAHHARPTRLVIAFAVLAQPYRVGPARTALGSLTSSIDTRPMAVIGATSPLAAASAKVAFPPNSADLWVKFEGPLRVQAADRLGCVQRRSSRLSHNRVLWKAAPAPADRRYAVRTRWSARRIIGNNLGDLSGNPGPLLPAA